MTLVKHELRLGRMAFLIWSGAIGILMVACIFLFPEMKGEMDSISDAFSSMGAFSQAFGMDQLDFGSFLGYYAIECGNVLGLGGAFFAALTAAVALSKEENEGTAEFLMTHPVSRAWIVAQKLLAVIFQITALSLTIYVLCLGAIAAIGETIPWKEITLLHLSYFLLQLHLAGICFAVSAFMRKGSVGAGLGIAIMMYFLNLISKITEIAEFLKYFTPFSYTDGATIVTEGTLDIGLVFLGMIVCICCCAMAFWKYCRKDLH